MIQISLANQSTLFSDKDLPALANALQIQVSRDFFPAWGVDAQIFYTPTGKHPTANHWVIALLDDADQAGALGYHDLSVSGMPLGKAFVRTTLADGGLVSVTVSHELLEMLGDPDVNLTAQLDTKLYAYEVSDAVESDADGYAIVIPSGWDGAGTSVTVSDFVLPSWFETFRTSRPFDFKGHITAPLQLLPGGYIGMMDLNNLSAGWQQVTADRDPKSIMASRPRAGSRRSRRAIPRSRWVRSTYTPGDVAEATVAGDNKMEMPNV